jgi:anti-sigma factor RsiW
MDCTGTKKLLNEYLDKALTDESKALVCEHLGSCASCEGEFRELLRVRSALKSAPRFDAPAGFSSRVMKKIRLEETPSAEEPGLFRWLWSMPMHLKLASGASSY